MGTKQREVVGHGVRPTIGLLDRGRVDPKPFFWISITVIDFDAHWAKTVQPISLAELGSVGSDPIDAEWFSVLTSQRVQMWSVVGTDVDRAPPLVTNTMVLIITDIKPLCLFFPFMPLHVEEFTGVMYWTDKVLSGSTFC